MKALGYELLASHSGGYPTGYLAVARKAGLLKGVAYNSGIQDFRALGVNHRVFVKYDGSALSEIVSIFEKITPSDPAVDFYIAARRPVYSYYLIEGSLQVNKFGSVVRFSYIADTYTNASRVDFEIIYVNERGHPFVSNSEAEKKLLSLICR